MAQFMNSVDVTRPFMVEDGTHRDMLGRWPGDAKVFAEKVV
jgi:hypothetical protein